MYKFFKDTVLILIISFLLLEFINISFLVLIKNGYLSKKAECNYGCKSKPITFSCGEREYNTVFTTKNYDNLFFSNFNKTDNKKMALFFGGSTTEGCHFWKHSYPKNMSETLNTSEYNFGQVGSGSNATNYYLKNLLIKNPENVEYIFIHDGYNDLLPIHSKLDDKFIIYKVNKSYIANSQKSYFNELPFKEHVLKHFGILSLVSYIKYGSIMHGDKLVTDDFYMGAKNNREIISLNDVYLKSKELQDQFIQNTKNNINIALNKYQNALVVFIVNPYIIPYHHENYPTGFRDERVANIMAELHKTQQQEVIRLKEDTFKQNKRVIFVDLREFSINNKHMFYDEFHANDIGNKEIAKIIYDSIKKSKLKNKE